MCPARTAPFAQPSAGRARGSWWAAPKSWRSPSPKWSSLRSWGRPRLWQWARQAFVCQGSCFPLALWVGVTFQQLAGQHQKGGASRAAGLRPRGGRSASWISSPSCQKQLCIITQLTNARKVNCNVGRQLPLELGNYEAFLRMHRNKGAVTVTWVVGSLYVAKGARSHNFCFNRSYHFSTEPQ